MRIEHDLSITQRLTKALPSGGAPTGRSPRLALVISRIPHERISTYEDLQEPSLYLDWIGVVLRSSTVGPVDKSITIDPLRKCTAHVPLDGPQGLLNRIPDPYRKVFEVAVSSGNVSHCDTETWEAVSGAIRTQHPSLAPLLNWLTAQANTPSLRSDLAEDRSWQEQQDAARTILRLADFPLSAFAAWQRPNSPEAPYLAGLIPEPVEHSLIDHDVRAFADSKAYTLASKNIDESTDDTGLFNDWQQHDGLRCDIHVIYDSTGRRLEMANVNATPVEGRLGTDMIYYHELTHSFVLVQYKRLDPHTRSITVNERLLSQIDRLGAVAKLSRTPTIPHDWRLSSDPCFLKLAYWPENLQRTQDLAPGMYLPLSYVKLLLEDECTRGRGNARVLGYENVERYLINTQFIELVKHGLAGTVGTTVEQLREFGKKQADEGYSVVMAAERGPESVGQRQRRTNRRSPKKSAYVHRRNQK